MKRRAFTLIELPVLRKRKRMAFTLIELLVVITIIALLASIVIPSLKSAIATARTVICANNLHHIGRGFQSQSAQKADAIAKPFPEKTLWPGIPQNVLPEHDIYFCPEEAEVQNSITRYEVHVTGVSNATGRAIDVYIRFEDSAAEGGLCKVIPRSDYTEYWFDDLWIPDIDDYLFRVTRTPPITATFWPDDPQVGSPGALSNKAALCRDRQVLDGWEDFRKVPQGEYITMSGGATNYGINALADSILVGSNKIVVLDYNRLVANQDEDLAKELADPGSARHRGRLNVLFADQSVRLRGPSELHPQVYPDLWSASAP